MLEDVESELSAEGYSLHTWSNGAHFWYPVHDHPYEKVIVVLEGSITFYLPAEEREIAMTKEDRLRIPVKIEHSATVGPHGVTCLEGQKI